MEEETELRNPFPSPPSHYTNYTTHNLRLLALLRERTPKQTDVTDGVQQDTVDVRKQHELLSDQKDIPDWPLTQLEPPRVDWILEEGQYNVFGDSWFIKDTIPSLAELGGHQLYPVDPAVDRRPALLSVLRSMLLTYSSLTKSLLAPPPPPYSEIAPDWQRHVEWLTILSQNLMAAANDLRPVQARVNLETMMQRQLDLRREETAALHAKCDTLETRLKELRMELREVTLNEYSNGSTLVENSQMKNSIVDMDIADSPFHVNSSSSDQPPTSVSLGDVLRWAEEIG